MVDTVLIQNGKAHQVIPGKTKQEVCYVLMEGETEPRKRFHPDVIASHMEVPEGTVQEGATWDGYTFTFTNPEPPVAPWPPGSGKPDNPGNPNPLIAKITIIERLHEAGKLEEYRTKLDAAPILFREKWNVVEKIDPYDQANLDFIASLGADPLVVLDPRPKPVVP